MKYQPPREVFREYPKINTLYKRDEKGRVVLGSHSRDVFGSINRWYITEKIDGMNIRIGYAKSVYSDRPELDIRYSGRTNAAVLPKPLLEFLTLQFNFKKMEKTFPYVGDGDEIVLFGEGYGPGINKGSRYSDTVGFTLFDVFFNNKNSAPVWAKRDAVRSIADSLGCETVPDIVENVAMTADQIVEYVRANPNSILAMKHGKSTVAEGIVARPLEPLFRQNGEPVMWKLKVRDFENTSKE